MSTELQAIASGLAAGLVSAWGLVRLWARNIQDTQREHAAKIETLLSVRCPQQDARVVRLENEQQHTSTSLARIEVALAAIHLRIDAMTKEVAQLVGRMGALDRKAEG